VSSRLPAIAAGQSDQVFVSWIPQGRGKATGQLVIDFASTTAAGARIVETETVTLTAGAVAPIIALRSTRPVSGGGGDVLVPVTVPPERFVGGRLDRIGGRIDRTEIGRVTIDPGLVPIPTGPPDLDLGDVEQGVDANGSFFIGNLGDTDLTVTGLAVRSGGFFGDPITFPFVVANGDWREIAVHTGTGLARPGDVLSSAWSVLSDDPAQPDARITIHVRVSGPRLERGPDFIDFGSVPAGTQASRQMVLSNTGNRPVTVDGAKWSVGSPFVFALPAGTNFPAVLPPGATLPITISVPANCHDRNIRRFPNCRSATKHSESVGNRISGEDFLTTAGNCVLLDIVRSRRDPMFIATRRPLGRAPAERNVYVCHIRLRRSRNDRRGT
jgi:hypothetical protein